MITIRLIDARRELSLKCRELFTNERIAKEIYGYLCDGLEECEEVEPEREKGNWHQRIYSQIEMMVCSECGEEFSYDAETGIRDYNFCPNCGADMRGEGEE